jgi:isoamylase
MTNGNVAVWKGNPYPLGATWDGEGVNFALFSEHAQAVEVCLFDTRGRREIARAKVKWQTDQVWHCYLPEARPGLLYGYRVYGPYDPRKGMRFNANKLVLDPYAKDIGGTIKWSDALFGYRVGSPREDLAMDRRDSAPGMPKARVIDGAFSWGNDRAPRTPWRDTVIYELHVKGFTINHPEIPTEMRGTYAALASAAAIEHLKRLGVTAIELMPVHAFVDDRVLIQRGLKNYWGYNSIGFFAPDPRYSHSGYVHEFKTMVKRMHSAGIEVILDVVYNHTSEGNHMGPTLSFRGIDNTAYYRLSAGDARFYMDFTGCGNTLNMIHPRVLQLIMDSLRYWVLEMHVDGFRFDLASALARELYEVDRLGAFFDIIHQDPVLSQVKLIAEPWDLGEGGYQVGNFPVGWAEWNGRYRDAIRSYWRGDGGLVGELGYRLTGSSDLYEQSGRRPYASVNFVTCHDGFTLRDLVSYNHKHNEANGEENRDGTDDNRSWNCGAEGATADPEIGSLRMRQMRNFLTTLFLAQGVPMLLAGDEICRSQKGNNNAYCQDNELGWIDWNSTPEDRAMVDFVSAVLAIRKRHPAFRRASFFRGRAFPGTAVKDIVWLTPRGIEMTEREWNDPNSHALGMFLSGDAIEDDDERGRPIADDNFLLLLNNSDKIVIFRPAPLLPRRPWSVLLDTARDRGGIGDSRRLRITDNFPLQPRSAALMTQPREAATRGPASVRTGRVESSPDAGPTR